MNKQELIRAVATKGRATRHKCIQGGERRWGTPANMPSGRRKNYLVRGEFLLYPGRPCGRRRRKAEMARVLAIGHDSNETIIKMTRIWE